MKYVVLNENTLGYIQPELPKYVRILRASILKGAVRGGASGYILLFTDDVIRPTTLADFDDYGLVPPPVVV